MQIVIWISIFVLTLIVLGALLAVAISMRKSSVDAGQAGLESHPQGYWIGTGLSIGIGLGIALGLVLDNLALGIAMGAAIGMAIGAALEQKNKDSLRPLTEQEQKFQKWGVAGGLLILLFLLGIFTFLLIIRMR